MAVTARGTSSNNTAGLSATLTPSGNFASDSYAVLVIAMDNPLAGTGTLMTGVTCTDTNGNTWTRRVTAITSNIANGGVELGIWTTPQDGGALTTGDTITVAWTGGNCTPESLTLTEVTGTSLAYASSGVGTNSTSSTSGTVTSSSLAIGETIVAAAGVEYGSGATYVFDSDTTNGSWAANQTAQIGVNASGGITALSQGKTVTAAGAQTWDASWSPTTTSAVVGWVSFTSSTVSGLPVPIRSGGVIGY